MRSREDIAHVERECSRIRAELAAATERQAYGSSKPRPAFVVDGDAAIAAAQAACGLHAERSAFVGGGSVDGTGVGGADTASALDKGDILRQMGRD